MVASITFMEQIGWDRIWKRQLELQRELRGKLTGLPGIEFLTPEEEGSYAGILGFKIPGGISPRLKEIMSDAQIRFREVREVDLDAMRISTHIFNNSENLDALVVAIKKVLS